MGTVEPSLAGPKRPQDRVPLKDAATLVPRGGEGLPAGGLRGAQGRLVFRGRRAAAGGDPRRRGPSRAHAVEGENYRIHDGSVVIAAITSCTNTSNPYVMIGAGLVARKARALGLTRKPWVKTSLAPGSQVVTDYLDAAGLTEDLDALGFNLVGYGCTTCIGNSGPLPENDLQGDPRRRPDRLLGALGQPQLRGPGEPRRPGELPRLAAAGRRLRDRRRHEHRHRHDPIGTSKDGNPVFLKDIWPTRPRSRRRSSAP
jgi:aconitate hydratase